MLLNLLLKIYCVLRSITVCSCVLCCTVYASLCTLWFATCCAILERVLSLSADHSITLETCRQAVTELHSSLRKTVMLYTTVSECVSVCVCVRGDMTVEKA